MCYWPSYELMSQKQLDWYYYLRTKFRKNEYPKSDLSYIFLYIYELINNVGTETVEDGLIRLINIWNAYKNSYKNLNNYLPEWIVDYMDIYKCQSEEAFLLLNKFELASYIPENFNISHYIDNKKVLPVELIARLSDYAFYKSNFIAIKEASLSEEASENDAPDNGKLFLNGLPIIINKIDMYMKADGKGIFEKFKPDVTQQKSKMPFRSAVFEQNLRTSPSTSDYTGYQPLRSFITVIIKHYENNLRFLCGYRGKLKADPLPEGILKIIKSSAEEDFTQSRRKDVVITVDKEKLVRLMKEAEIIRKKLLEPINEPAENEERPTVAYETPVPEENMEKSDNLNISENPIIKTYVDWVIVEKENSQKTSQILKNPSGSDGERLITALSDKQRQILKYLIGNNGRCDEKLLLNTFKNIFVTTEADSINEKALEVFNDLLIAFEDGIWYIIDDYIGEIKEYLK
ncbi:MAG: hypothetical protein K0S55_706 [Clostridia bacterium]|nr:hypothetical protein [Clostridia bacterium]